MKINGTDISLFRARQQRVSFEHHSIKNNSEWMGHSAVPYFEKNMIGMKSFTVELVVKGEGREGIIANTSNILALLMEPCSLTLDGFSHIFTVVLKRHGVTETSMRRWHILKLEFEGYERGNLLTVSGTASLIATNPGNIVSPCVIEITPQVGVASISISGLCRDSYTGADKPVVIKDTEANKKIVIDGLSGLITQNGTVKEVEMWALPTLLPGKNTITCSSSRMNISVSVTPLYM